MSDLKGKIRVRACGVLLEDDSILLMQLKSPVNNQLIWTPPGGAIEFGESLKDTVIREFREETGLEIQVGKLIHQNELIENQFHAIELYYLVTRIGGELKLGVDPEYQNEDQILTDCKFVNREEIEELNVVPGYFKNQFWEELEG